MPTTITPITKLAGSVHRTSLRRRLRAELLEDRRLMAANPLPSVPSLNSYPTASAAIYLDFDGHFEPTWGAYSNITTPPFDSDGDATTFSDAELQYIEDMWRMVAEDYAPFNINVTTVEPAVLAEGVPPEEANGKALRVAIGGNSEDWLGGNWGGYSYYQSFTNSISNVAYVFAEGATEPRWLAPTVSHEAGHSFGLMHFEDAYDTVNQWHPIMAAASFGYDAITWHRGVTSSGAIQDDISVLANATNGFGYRADDHGNTATTATALAASDGTYSGIIGAGDDVDVFAITTAESRSLEVKVAGLASGQNLDAVVELLDASGNVLISSAPEDSNDATFIGEFTGTRYIAVKSNGVYGRIGQYTLSVTESLPGVRVSQSSAVMTTSELGRSESLSIVLNSKPTADVTIDLVSSDTGEGVLDRNHIVFTPSNWYLPQTIAITGVDDGVFDSDHGFIVSVSATSTDPDYNGMQLGDIGVTNLSINPGRLMFLSYESGVNGFVNSSSRLTHAVSTTVDLKAALGTAAASYTPTYLAVDAAAGKMYWSDAGADSINRANLDGSSPEVIVTGLMNPSGLAVDAAAGKIYFADASADKLQRANLDGSGVEDVITTGLRNVKELELDSASGKLYWVDSLDGGVYRANLDGSGIEVVLASDEVNRPYSLELDVSGGKLYIGTREGSMSPKLYRLDLDGGNQELLVDMHALDPSLADNNKTITSVTIDHNAARLYWTSGTQVYSADLDGSDAALVVDNTSNHFIRGLAFVAAKPGVTVTPLGGSETSESGGKVGFTVVLDAPPTADVTIPVRSTNTSEGTTSVSSLTFTSSNWNDPQPVQVTGVNDTIVDGNVEYVVALDPAISSDARYSGMDPGDMLLTNLDDDVQATKFFVVDDGRPDRTYEYSETGAFVENYSISSGNTQPRGAAASADGTRVWVADRNRGVYVYDSAGSLQGSWSLGSLSSKAQVEGVATDGTDVWIVDNSANRVYRYSDAARRVSGSQDAVSSFALNRSNGNPSGIVTDGVHLWVLENGKTDKVFKYATSGSLIGSWSIDSANSSPTGLTIDPSGAEQHVWVVDSGTDRVYQYDNARSLSSGSLAASTTFALAAGNTNPQGIADPPAAMATQPQSQHDDWFALLATDLAKTASPAAQARSAADLPQSPVDARTIRRASMDAFRACTDSRSTGLIDLLARDQRGREVDDLDLVFAALGDDLLSVKAD